MYFNPTKSIHLHINAKAITEYRIADTNIVTKKDLGIVMSNDLSWNQHYEKIKSQKFRECWGCFSASVCFCQENIILIFGGKISSYVLIIHSFGLSSESKGEQQSLF